MLKTALVTMKFDNWMLSNFELLPVGNLGLKDFAAFYPPLKQKLTCHVVSRVKPGLQSPSPDPSN